MQCIQNSQYANDLCICQHNSEFGMYSRLPLRRKHTYYSTSLSISVNYRLHKISMIKTKILVSCDRTVIHLVETFTSMLFTTFSTSGKMDFAITGK